MTKEIKLFAAEPNTGNDYNSLLSLTFNNNTNAYEKV